MPRQARAERRAFRTRLRARAPHAPNMTTGDAIAFVGGLAVCAFLAVNGFLFTAGAVAVFTLAKTL